MRISMQSGPRPDLLQYSSWDVVVGGNAVDDRGKAALEFASKNASTVHVLRYTPNPPELEFNGKTLPAEDIETIVQELLGMSCLLETTTLGFVEVLLACRAFNESGSTKISLLYTEPQVYRRPLETMVLHKRDFELSDEVEEFSGVPGSVFMLREDQPTKAIFLVGYEGQRLDQALEQTGVKPSECSVVFGVPAFQAGWEMNSFANNVRVLRQREITGEILFGGAQNPVAAYSAIDRVYNSCSREREERLLIAPIGTKPHGIGAALFACTHPDVGVVYDHPRRSKGRSSNIATWHLFEVNF